MKQYIGVDIGGTKCAVTLGIEDAEDLIRDIDNAIRETEAR